MNQGWDSAVRRDTDAAVAYNRALCEDFSCVAPFLLVAVLAWSAGQKSSRYRWVYISRRLRSDQDVEDIRQIARTASENGLNGVAVRRRPRLHRPASRPSTCRACKR